MNIARVLGCPVATVLRTDIATKMKICFIRHEKVVKVVVIQRVKQNFTAFRFTVFWSFIAWNITGWQPNPPGENPIAVNKYIISEPFCKDRNLILRKCPTWRTNSFRCIYLFIVLYMFRACHAHHQEKQILSIQFLVIVTL